MNTPNETNPDHKPGQHGFEFDGFKVTPSDGAITQFAQTEGPCYDADKPCHVDTVGDFDNSTTYSTQVFLETTVLKTTFRVDSDRKPENWDGSPPPNMIYSLDAAKNTMDCLDPAVICDPDHTAQ